MPSGQEIDTAAEFDLLRSLPATPTGRSTVTRSWSKRTTGLGRFDRSIDLRIMRLRRKIERKPDKPEVIKTVCNVGYILRTRQPLKRTGTAREA